VEGNAGGKQPTTRVTTSSTALELVSYPTSQRYVQVIEDLHILLRIKMFNLEAPAFLVADAGIGLELLQYGVRDDHVIPSRERSVKIPRVRLGLTNSFEQTKTFSVTARR